MTDIKNWYATAAGNDISGPPDYPQEGWSPNEVNDWGREVMAAVRRWYNDPEWLDLNASSTITRVSDTQFTVSGVDATGWFTMGRRVKLVGASTAYGFVTSSSFSTNTTVNVTMDGGVVPSSLTSAQVHHTTALSAVAYTGSVIPTGIMVPFAGAIASIPSGYLLCDGSELLKSSYAALWAAFGSAHIYGNPANPTTHFKLPNMGGKVVVGYVSGGDGDGDYGTVGGEYGSKKHALAAAEAPANATDGTHAHSGSTGTVTGYPSSGATNVGGSGTNVATDHVHGVSLSGDGAHTHAHSGTGTAHENRQPSVVNAWIIKT